jgi:hypothetical protein
MDPAAAAIQCALDATGRRLHAEGSGGRIERDGSAVQ